MDKVNKIKAAYISSFLHVSGDLVLEDIKNMINKQRLDFNNLCPYQAIYIQAQLDLYNKIVRKVRDAEGQDLQ